jgi:hypothetical protein
MVLVQSNNDSSRVLLRNKFNRSSENIKIHSRRQFKRDEVFYAVASSGIMFQCHQGIFSSQKMSVRQVANIGQAAKNSR